LIFTNYDFTISTSNDPFSPFFAICDSTVSDHFSPSLILNSADNFSPYPNRQILPACLHGLRLYRRRQFPRLHTFDYFSQHQQLFTCLCDSWLTSTTQSTHTIPSLPFPLQLPSILPIF